MSDSDSLGCMTCGGYEDMPGAQCPKSRRVCGHHCNHIWVHDICDWCGEAFEPTITPERAGFDPDEVHKLRTDGTPFCTLCGRYASDPVHDA